ncbi:uncharacterized [Tachysurus ichikawai]
MSSGLLNRTGSRYLQSLPVKNVRGREGGTEPMQISKGSLSVLRTIRLGVRVCDIPTVGHAPAPYKSNRLHSSCTNPDGKVKEQKVHSLYLISSPPSLPKEEREKEKRSSSENN